MSNTKRTIYLLLGSLVFFSAVTVINPLQASNVFAGFKRFVKQIKIVDWPDTPLSVVVQGAGNNNGSQEKELVEIVFDSRCTTGPPTSPSVAYIVPAGKQLVITDLGILNSSQGRNFAGLGRNANSSVDVFDDVDSLVGLITGLPLGDAREAPSFGHSFRQYQSGVVFNGGESVYVHQAVCQRVLFEIRGYLTDLT